MTALIIIVSVIMALCCSWPFVLLILAAYRVSNSDREGEE